MRQKDLAGLSYTIYPEHNLVYMKLTGGIAIDAFIRSVLAVADDPAFVRGMSTLLDCTEAEVPASSREDEKTYEQFAEELTNEETRGYRRKLAVVAGDNLAAFGVSRMREVPLSDSLLEMHVFRGQDEALEWLELNTSLSPTLSADNNVKF